MKFAIHQPNFIPWIGFFDKIKQVDKFVILDTVQYPRGKSVANRNSVKNTSGQKLELVVPMSKPKGKESKVSYMDVEFAEANWQKKILKSIEYNYKKAQHFDLYFAFLESLFKSHSFVEMNINFIKETLNYLEIDTEILHLSKLKNVEGVKTERIISIAKNIGCNHYVSGIGAKKYNDIELYDEAKINLTYHNFIHPIYDQINGEFLSHLSIIDLLFNLGPKSVNIINC